MDDAQAITAVQLSWSHLLVVALLLGLLTFVLYLPVVLVSGPERVLANRFLEPLGGQDLARDLTTSLRRTWEFWNRDLPWPGVALLVLGVVAESARALRQRRVPLAVLAVGTCLLLVLLQRVAPFERVWLFLLPVYFVLASAGLVGPLSTFRFSRWAGPAGAVVLACGLGALVLRSGSILTSQETGAFPDASAVTQALRGRLGPDDAVLTTVPASLPELQYYFRRDGLPVESLVRPPEAALRLFVVATADPPNAALEARFSSANLYRLEHNP